jgi:hypothetical protein
MKITSKTSLTLSKSTREKAHPFVLERPLLITQPKLKLGLGAEILQFTKLNVAEGRKNRG